ncbi:MAG: hypothetical protein JWN45_2843, partial [Acidobacteriaceae bacterium]|nr:hypothetical protein [Acidobacteriaceae bacterium]
MKFRRSPVTLVILLCLSGYLYGQSWSGILNSRRAVDWSNAGVVGGIPTNRVQCVTAACNTVSSGTVTTTSINAAIASAPSNTYVQIPAGTFTIMGGILFSNKSYVTVRGMGSNSTFLNFTGGNNGCGGGSHDICAQSSDINYMGGPSNTANWSGTNGVSGTYTKGATSILLSSVTSLTVGDPIVLDQVDDAADNNGLWVGCEVQNSRCGNDGPSGYQRTSGGVRGQQQMVTVTSISGTGPYTVGISPGIYASNWRASQSPGAWWASSPIFGDAIESISLDHTGGGDGILFFNCSGCWVKGVRSIRNSATGTAWFHVSLYLCNHCTVRDSYFYGLEGDSYVIPASIASDALIENNIFQRPGGVVFNSDCEGCVVAYNFSVNPGSNSPDWLSQSHWLHSVALFVLDEGNIGAGFFADGYHGTHVLNTQFRNRWNGREQNSGNLPTGNTAAIQLAPGARYHNVIGNVLGTVGYHTSYLSTPGNDHNWTAAVSAGLFPGTGGTDSLPYPTSIWWGNWDTGSNAVRWCGNSSNTGWSTTCASTSEVPTGLSSYSNAIPASQTLPASFYLPSKPSWVPSAKPWPLIGPDVTGGTVGQCVGGTMATSSCTASSQCGGGGSCSVVASGKV